jgi:hypothetical protein
MIERWRGIKTNQARGIVAGLGIALIFGCLMSPASAATKILTGKHTVIYDIVNPTGVEFLPNYSNNSYSQKIIQEDEFSKRVLIEISDRYLQLDRGQPYL